MFVAVISSQALQRRKKQLFISFVIKHLPEFLYPKKDEDFNLYKQSKGGQTNEVK